MIVRLQQFVFLLNLDKITKKKQVNKKISYKNKQADMSIYSFAYLFFHASNKNKIRLISYSISLFTKHSQTL
jgi:hypothetical protein